MDIGRFDKVVKYPQRARGVQDFLANNKFVMVDDNVQGISWVELYTLYKLQGGSCMVDNLKGKAAARPMMRQQLKAFVSTTRAIAR